MKRIIYFKPIDSVYVLRKNILIEEEINCFTSKCKKKATLKITTKDDTKKDDIIESICLCATCSKKLFQKLEKGE